MRVLHVQNNSGNFALNTIFQLLQRGTNREDVGGRPLRVLLSYIIIHQFPQANFFRPIEQERNLYMSQSIALYLF